MASSASGHRCPGRSGMQQAGQIRGPDSCMGDLDRMGDSAEDVLEPKAIDSADGQQRGLDVRPKKVTIRA